jgi:PAS domain S-box-containing protein
MKPKESAKSTIAAEDGGHRRIFRRAYSRDRLFLYLIPIIIGIGGIAISMQLRDLYVRIIILMLSVSIPLYAGGNVLARYRTGRVERFFLGLGLFMLIFGETLSVSGLGTGLAFDYRAWFAGENLMRLLGVLSLMLGLFSILFTLGRTGEDIEEIGERFWRLAAHMSEGVILSDREGYIILVNDRFLEMLGLREKDILGANTVELAQRFGMNIISENIEKRRKGVSSEYSINFKVRGEERSFVVNGSPIFDSEERFTATLATFRDNTEEQRLRERVERYASSLEHLVEEQTQRLIESEERLRQLLLSMSEGFLTIDAENRVRFVNERMLQILGCTRGDILEHELAEYLDPAGRIRLLNLVSRDAGPDGEPARQEVTFISRAGVAVPVMAALSRMADAHAEGPQYSLVITDISDLKAMESQLRDRAEELEQANEELRLHDRAKDSFLSNVSHELRTPLSTVNGYVEMLSGGTLGVLQPEQDRVLGVMKRNLDRLGGLINEIIEFSRMEIRGLDLSISLFDVEDFVNEAAASAHPGATEKEIGISCEFSGNPGYAWGDRRRLQQVLAILLNNAIKFTGNGGSIVMRAERTASRAIILSVVDEGIGIDPALHDKVFEKFFQVDSSKTRRYEGAGIGLSIAKNIAESHGGDITLESAPGRGSAFTMSLPDAAFDDTYPEGYNPLDSEQVLLLDESGEAGRLFERLLASRTGTFTAVSGSFQIIRHIENEGADIVIIDAGPTDVAGLGTERVLLQHPASAHIPRLVLTQETATTVAGIDEAIERTTFLFKPYNANQLFEAIGRALRGEYGSAVVKATGEALPQVIVIDPDPELLAFVELALTSRGIPCCIAHHPEQAINIARNVPVRALLIDADFTATNIQEYLLPLQEAPQTKEAPIYFLTGVENGYHGMVGVSGVLRKPFTASQLAALLQNEEEVKRA